ncbi:MAG: hypothetical protein B6D45_00250 [Ignavibacteriales bacterium UTCHB3]|nr:MAG: hypothetical protein B6D45_00250 [Ignavibacteriales bacterium UTCHB3]
MPFFRQIYFLTTGCFIKLRRPVFVFFCKPKFLAETVFLLSLYFQVKKILTGNRLLGRTIFSYNRLSGETVFCMQQTFREEQTFAYFDFYK